MRRLLGVILLLASPSLADAASPGVFQTPVSRTGVPAYSARNGLHFEIDTRWFDVGGYRPLRLQMSSANPSPADRAIKATLSLTDNSRGNGATMVVRQEWTLHAGEDFAETVVLCPATGAWSNIDWQVEVDGQPEPALSIDPRMALPIVSNGGDALVRLLRLKSVTGGSASNMDRERWNDQLTVGRNRQMMVSRLNCEPLGGWLDYTSADVVTFDMKELQRYAVEHPDELLALRRWLLAGGVVWIEGVDKSPETYQEIDDIIGLGRWRMTSTDEEPDESEANLPGTANPPPATGESGDVVTPEGDVQRDRKGSVTPIADAPGWGYVRIPPPDDPTDRARLLAERGMVGILSGLAEDTRGWYAQREAGFGRVMAFNQRPFDVPPALQRGPSRQVIGGWQADRWAARHGVEPAGASPEFGNLLIPGVGVAPVNEFQVLITLFVLAIGPLNYWLLWRRQQLHLLVLTTPLFAAVATLALTAYASVADGFGVKARVRSVTLLDQTTGEAANWSRVSHYIATTPKDPAALPADTAIYPITPGWESALAGPNSAREIDWRGGEQTLTKGWFPSRTTVQHLLVRSCVSGAKLVFSGEKESLRVDNRLGAPLELLVVRNDDGDWLQAVEVAADTSTPLESVDRFTAMQAFRTLAISNVPTFPDGAGRAIEDTLERLGSTDIRSLQRSMSSVRLGDNRMNRVLDALTGLDGGRSLDLPPRSYVAITTQSVETPLCWDDVEEVGSFHVVVGRW